MNETMNWEDLRLFLAVARAGGLAAASQKTALSPPTLGRRMLALERSLDAILFIRRRDGYDLTADGRALLERAEELERGALSVERWRAERDQGVAVRIAAGAWSSAFLASHIGDLRAAEADPSIELTTGSETLDLTRRSANLGLRNRRPENPGLAGRRLTKVAFAAYGATGYVEANPAARTESRFAACDWIAFAAADHTVPSAVWLTQRLDKPAILRCSNPRPCLDAALAGAGLCILPCFIGDRQPGLIRVSDLIPELGHDQWLVSHNDDRHNKAIRQVANRLARLIRANRDLFSGALA